MCAGMRAQFLRSFEADVVEAKTFEEETTEEADWTTADHCYLRREHKSYSSIIIAIINKTK